MIYFIVGIPCWLTWLCIGIVVVTADAQNRMAWRQACECEVSRE